MMMLSHSFQLRFHTILPPSNKRRRPKRAVTIMELKQEDLFVQGSRRDQIEGGEDTKFEYF